MEKRKFRRIFSASKVDLYSISGEFICHGSMWNLSRGGILVAYCDKDSLDSFVPKQRVRFESTLTTGKVTGTGEVAWLDREELQFGLKFITIEKKEDGISNLIDFITSDICGWTET